MAHNKPIHPKKLAVAIRDICNHWPAYSHMKEVPKHSEAIAFQTMDTLYSRSSEESSEIWRLRQQYLNTLN